MIDVKQAFHHARESFEQLLADQAYSNVLLEEVELTPDEKFWNITLGYDLKESMSTPLTALNELFPRKLPRHYKVFKIDAESGQVWSMKVRNLWSEQAAS